MSQGATDANAFNGSAGAFGNGALLDLSFSSAGRRGIRQAGLSVGSGGIRAFYDRQRFDHHDLHGLGHHDFHGDDGFHDFHDFHDHGFHGLHGHGFGFFNVGFHGAFHLGHYYPYGYLSHYDTYYYRYPYDYLSFYDYTPNWTVYVDAPVVDAAYLGAPSQTVYVDASSAGSGGAGESSAPADVVGPSPQENVAGPAYGADSKEAPQPDADGVIRVEPQERIPVQNASLARGEQAFREGDYEAARQAFSYAVLEEPENGFAELAYGLVHFAMGSYDAAADAIRRGLGRVPDVIDRPIDIGRQYGDADDLRAHLQALQLYVAAHPGDANAWFVLGYTRYSTGEPAAGLRAFSKAASLNPNDSYAGVLRDAAERVTVR